MNGFYLALAAAVFVAGCAATADYKNSDAAPQGKEDAVAKAEGADSDGSSDVICRREKQLGSNLPKKTCYRRVQPD